MPCWHENTRPSGKKVNGRRNCQDESEDFNRAEGDLHNLMFADGYINAYRSNFRHTDFGKSESEKMFGQCKMVIDRENRQSKPPAETRGLIARAYLYMAMTYDVKLSKREELIYSFWDRRYPPDETECARDMLIAIYQDNSNPILKGRCPQKTRGMIARTYLYLAMTDKVKLSKEDRLTYSAWDKQYLPDKTECANDRLIKKLYGISNPILKGRCPQTQNSGD